jgi:tRNA (guanine37-N1)-methyltransferase
MPLPEKAQFFVESAVESLLDREGTIHYFLHVKANSKKLAVEVGRLETDHAFRDYHHEILFSHVVREVGPRIYQVVSDVGIKK